MAALEGSRLFPQVNSAYLVQDKDTGDLGELGQTLEQLGTELVPSPLIWDIHKNYNCKMAG
jgi:hypothetical protein